MKKQWKIPPSPVISHIMISLDKDSTMDELTRSYPGARRALFAKYHIGGCSSCAYQPEETISEVCLRNSLDLSEVIQHVEDSHKHDKELLISPQQLASMIENGAPFQLIDTRTREEHEAVSIADSQFLTEELQQSIFAQCTPESTIILYDHTGRDVLDKVAWFVGHSLPQTKGLEGGIDAYSQQIDSSLPRYRLELD